ncbi:MAG: PfkB family carbohydrate kinase [Nanoarchaeota archaeon]
MKSLSDALNFFKDKRAAVVGDILLDQSIMGEVKRLNPENPAVPLSMVSDMDYRLGGAANVARNLASLGSSCHLFGQVGKDAYGDKIRELCNESGIETFLADSGRETIVKQRIFSDGRYIARIDFGEKNLDHMSINSERYIESEIAKNLNLYDLILFGDYDKGVFRGNLASRVIKLGKSGKILTVADPKPANIDGFMNCNVIRLNRNEAEKIVGNKYGGNDLRITAEIMAERTNPRYIVITCGAEGAFAYDAEREFSHTVPARKVEIGDPTGAGDTFAAALGLSMASGLSFEESVRLANHASTIVVGKIGTAVTNISELRRALNLN